MGEVYRARDPRLGRDIAIKILPSDVSLDPERLQRFEQEARAASLLNHPNIISVYDIGFLKGSPYLVTELLEGETLSAKLEHGALAERKSVEFALQIAQGLSAAHEKGIIHRDLKPANLFITKEGRLKILDFGLAKLTQIDAPLAEVTHLPTSPGTEPGMVLGTMGYMSPEQVRGQQVDQQSDIFSFGVILYEMLTGKRAFAGHTAADTIGAILHKEPPEVTQSVPTVSSSLVRIVYHCLEKNPEQRFHSVSDIAFDLQSLSGISETTARASVAAPRQKFPLYLWQTLAVAGCIAAIVSGILYYRIHSKPVETYHLSVELPAKWNFELFNGGLALSPDGKYLAFVAVSEEGKQQIWLRSVNRTAPQLLAGTEDASYLFWSPDSQYLAFFIPGKLKKIRISGGASQTICEASSGRGGTWNREGIIVFAPQPYGGLQKVSSAGGKPEAVTQTNGPKVSHRWPSFLPDGDHFFFCEDPLEGILLGSLKAKETKVLIPDLYTNAIYAEPGYILYFGEAGLAAQRFDANALKLTGEAFPLLEEKVNYTPLRGLTAVSVSQTGTLAYQPEEPTVAQLKWLDPSGKETGLATEDRYDRGLGLLNFSTPGVSPDGSKILLRRWDRNAGRYDLWILDASTRQVTRFTRDRDVADSGVWSPDQSQIAYASKGTMYLKSVSGAAEKELVREDRDFHLFSWSPDGKLIIYSRQNAAGDSDLYAVPLSGSEKPHAILATPNDEGTPSLSPDGKWLAYTSDSTGQVEFYVCPFPDCDRQWKVSNSGSVELGFWSKDGARLYYQFQNRIMAAQLKANKGEFQFSPPALLFTVPRNTRVDSAPDGRFLASEPAQEANQNFLRLIIHWSALLKQPGSDTH